MHLGRARPESHTTQNHRRLFHGRHGPTDDVDDAWPDLEEVLGPDGIIPITDMNSLAGIKALCGRNGGAVCTSSNAKAVFEWALDQGERVLFLRD